MCQDTGCIWIAVTIKELGVSERDRERLVFNLVEGFVGCRSEHNLPFSVLVQYSARSKPALNVFIKFRAKIQTWWFQQWNIVFNISAWKATHSRRCDLIRFKLRTRSYVIRWQLLITRRLGNTRVEFLSLPNVPYRNPLALILVL